MAILTGNIEIEGVETGKERKKVVPVDELLTWSIANAKTISNNYGEIKIDKDISEDRIDPIDAIIDAWKLAMKDEYNRKHQHSTNMTVRTGMRIQTNRKETCGRCAQTISTE